MAFKEPKLGFWIPIRDNESAEYAAKMSGLPVFIMGICFTISGLIILLGGPNIGEKTFGGVIMLAGIFFIFSGLRIRNHKFKTLPISVSLWLLLSVTGMLLSFISGGIPIGLNLLIGLLAISGLRGWLWLRKNPGGGPEDFT